MKCLISGWGSMNEKGKYPINLLMVKVNLIPTSTCRLWGGFYLNKYKQCAGFEEGGIDSCQGDSGGPLVCKLDRSQSNKLYFIFCKTLGYFGLLDNRFTLWGTTSYGRGCARPRRPGIYAKTVTILSWIKRLIVH